MSDIPASIGGVLGKAVEGMSRATEKLNRAAEKIAEGEIDPRDMVEMKLAETSFAANAAVARTADQTFRRLLDIKV